MRVSQKLLIILTAFLLLGLMAQCTTNSNEVEEVEIPLDSICVGDIAFRRGEGFASNMVVYHDIDGLAELHGGKEKLIKKLDELFAADPKYTVGYYDNEIHEMSEMSSVDFGQCAISNQPSFHIPWLYSYLGEKEKTEYWIEKIVDKLFSYKETGFPGDEDNGTMACWYIFACLGFYPLCPGKL